MRPVLLAMAVLLAGCGTPTEEPGGWRVSAQTCSECPTRALAETAPEVFALDATLDLAHGESATGAYYGRVREGERVRLAFTGPVAPRVQGWPTEFTGFLDVPCVWEEGPPPIVTPSGGPASTGVCRVDWTVPQDLGDRPGNGIAVYWRLGGDGAGPMSFRFVADRAASG